MISVIVVSKNDDLFSQFQNSVRQTIGVPFEMIKIENSGNEFSIFEAYNIGASKSNNEVLVFVHEDIIFHTNEWGKVLLMYFKTLINPGVLGIAGSSYLPISPSDWWLSNRNYIHSNFISNSKDGVKSQGILKCEGKQIPQKVYALDGMFLALKRKVFKESPFDENLKGFHGYDTDLCYQVSKNYQNYFIPGILLEHFSKGYPNSTWLKNTIEANRKAIPFILHLKSEGGIDSNLEFQAFHLFLGQLNKFGNNPKQNLGLAISYFSRIIMFRFQWKLVFLLFKYSLIFVFRINSSNNKK